MCGACETMQKRFEAMKEQGLVDVKFTLADTNEASLEDVCSEVLAILDDLEQGKAIEFRFGDSSVKCVN